MKKIFILWFIKNKSFLVFSGNSSFVNEKPYNKPTQVDVFSKLRRLK